MLHIGLTGGIGAGKSTVAGLLAGHGAVVIDADRISRELMAPGSPLLAEVADEFGAGVVRPDGALDRSALARLVFGDEEARQVLNSIVHPAVREEAARQWEEAPTRPGFRGVVVEDIPLLAESGQADRFDGVVVVEAAERIRVERLVGRRGMAEDDARARIAAQASDAERREIATWIIDNSGAPEETEAGVERLWAELRARAGGAADSPSGRP